MFNILYLSFLKIVGKAYYLSKSVRRLNARQSFFKY